MNTTTTDAVEPHGHNNYILITGFFAAVFLLFILAYASYIWKYSRSLPETNISFDSTAHGDADNHHLLTFSHGIDDDVLVTFPSFLYCDADATVTHKGDTAADDNSSGCSICLAEYKPTAFVRLLPECSHLFHVKCIDTWLKAHATCPVCRNSPHSRNSSPVNLTHIV